MSSTVSNGARVLRSYTPWGVLLGVAAVVGGVTGEAPWWHPLGVVALGIAICGAFLTMLLTLIRGLLVAGSGVAVVARMSLDEALARRVVWGAALLLWLAAVALPSLLGDRRFDYRLQSYLTYSLGFSGLLLAVMTVFMACASIAHEVEDRRVYTSLVKPIRRWRYVAGKALALVLLNFALLSTVALSIWGMSRWQMADAWRQIDRAVASGSPTLDSGVSLDDARASLERIRAQLLVGRGAYSPTPPPGYIESRVEERLRKLQQEGVETTPERVLANERKGWRFVPPGEARSFLFDLSDLTQLTSVEACLHLQPRAPFFAPQESFPLEVQFPGGSRPNSQLWVQSSQDVFIPFDDSDKPDSGVLTVVLHNLSPPGGPSLAFSSARGVEVVFVATSFATNLVRALLVVWGKLSFLAVLGVFASGFLGFPVACLFALIFALCAAVSDHIVSSAGVFDKHRQVSEGVVAVLEQSGVAIASSLRPFTELPVTSRVVSGRLLLWREVGETLLWVTLLWGGCTLALGGWIFSRRELARVQV